ncbi:MAG: cache domain-containing protein [Candidatus Omnitrophica bacterium]|jgi:hypothetical protein|nr:cache domain-containing protein [Candidatus Omnitrophota bacterium]
MKKLAGLAIGCIFFFCSVTALAAEITEISAGSINDPRIVLEELKVKVNKVFKNIEDGLASAAKELATSGLTGPEARKILNNLCQGKAYAVDCVAVNSDGIMVSIEPEKYKEFEGKDISAQEHIIRSHKTQQPAVSNVFLSEEGQQAIDFCYPVFSDGNKFTGSANVLIAYEKIFAPIIMPIVASGPLDVWIIQKDGLTLYDPDKDEIGRNVFEDPMYKPFPSYVALCRRIAAEESGFGSYNFLNKGLQDPVNKDAAWTTIRLHGIEWRMVVVRERKTIGG